MQQPKIRPTRSANSIQSSDIFTYKGKRLIVKWEILFSKLLGEQTLTKADVVLLIKAANKYFRAEPNMLYLHDPVTIVGDIHGQFHDLKEIFRLGENPGTITKYLFLGDYVDRGNYSLEVIFVLYALKIAHPNEVFLLRGNHECKLMTVTHNFRTDCLKKYDQELYSMFIESFNNLPISCIINGKYLAVHGGLSPKVKSILEINKLNRFREPPSEGVLCDLLWADPTFDEGGVMKSKFEQNESRGCSFFFGYEATIDFLRQNELLTIIRAHEVQYEGYRAYHWGNSIFPVLMTVFSAPNYCGHHQNKGAILKIHQNEIQIMQYSFTEKKELSMDFPNVFVATWEVLHDGINEISNNLQRKIIKSGFNEEASDPIIEREFDAIFQKIKHKIKFKVNEHDTGKGTLRPIKVGIRKSKSRNTHSRPRSLHPNQQRRTMAPKGSHSVTNLLTRSPISMTSSSVITRSQGSYQRPSNHKPFGTSSGVYSQGGRMTYSTLQSSGYSSGSYNRPKITVSSTAGALKHSGVVTRRKFEYARSNNLVSEKRP
jgi:serine/threonine-protein phosphatase 2B catalytic subunit